MKKANKGFTLIELLVVIAIIGLLSTLAVVALNNARQKSRDARRLSDVKQIQTALELYFNDAGAYPAALGTTIATTSVTYMNIVPTNPLPQADGASCSGFGNYAYATQLSNSSYTLTYCLSGVTGGITAGPHTATPAGVQ